MTPLDSILALDVGTKRIGVAIASKTARLARPLTTLKQSDKIITEIVQLVADQAVSSVVVGLPRNMSGVETDQTKLVRTFAAKLKDHLDRPIHFQDETLTSVKAREELDSQGVKYNKGQVDALAATYILEDYLQAQIQEV